MSGLFLVEFVWNEGKRQRSKSNRHTRA